MTPSRRMITERVKFKTHKLGGICLSALPKSELQSAVGALIRCAQSDKWWGTDTERYSLVKVNAVDAQYVSGFITQQYAVELHKYDSGKQENTKEDDSYEDRLFVLDTHNDLLSLEWRQFRGKPPLTLRSTVQRLAEVLSRLLIKEGILADVCLSDIYQETTKEQFVEIFYANRVLSLVVHNYGLADVPDSVQLVNPDGQLEDFARKAILHDVMKRSVDKVALEAYPDGDLRGSITGRSAIHSSGTIRQLGYEGSDGFARVRRRTERGEFEVEVPVYPTDSPADRVEMVAGVIRAMNEMDINQEAPAGRRREPTMELEGLSE